MSCLTTLFLVSEERYSMILYPWTFFICDGLEYNIAHNERNYRCIQREILVVGYTDKIVSKNKNQ